MVPGVVKAEGRAVAGLGKAEQSQWKEGGFFFVQAADTQLGMMDYWGSNGKVPEVAYLYR